MLEWREHADSNRDAKDATTSTGRRGAGGTPRASRRAPSNWQTLAGDGSGYDPRFLGRERPGRSPVSRRPGRREPLQHSPVAGRHPRAQAGQIRSRGGPLRLGGRAPARPSHPRPTRARPGLAGRVPRVATRGHPHPSRHARRRPARLREADLARSWTDAQGGVPGPRSRSTRQLGDTVPDVACRAARPLAGRRPAPGSRRRRSRGARVLGPARRVANPVRAATRGTHPTEDRRGPPRRPEWSGTGRRRVHARRRRARLTGLALVRRRPRQCGSDDVPPGSSGASASSSRSPALDTAPITRWRCTPSAGSGVSSSTPGKR